MKAKKDLLRKVDNGNSDTVTEEYRNEKEFSIKEEL